MTIPEEDVGDEDKEEENDDDIVCEEDKKLRPPFFWSFGVCVSLSCGRTFAFTRRGTAS